MNLEEFNACAAGQTGSFVGLFLQGGEQCLEPFKGACVFADPDKLDSAKTCGRVGRVAQVPDVFENGGPGCNTDTCADEDGDFVFKDVLCWCTVWSVDAQAGHLLAVLEGDFVHAHGIDAVVEFSLSVTGTKGVTERLRKISDLADVDGDVRVEWA